MRKLNFIFLLFIFSALCFAQDALKTADISIKKHKLTIEIADTPQTMARGLMYRENLGENNGMLFVFPEPERATFWMRNTSLPLSIAYIDNNGKILEIYPLEPYNEKTVPSKSTVVRFALEVNRGWFEAKGIKQGDMIEGLPKF